MKLDDVSGQEVPLSGRSASEPRGEDGLERHRQRRHKGDRFTSEV